MAASTNDSGGFLGFALRYGLRSLSRNKKRTLLVTATVALSTVVSVVGMSYASAIIRIWAQGAIDFGLGHAQLHTETYWNNPDVLRRDHLVEDDAAATAELLGDARVRAVSKRIKFEGNISVSNKTVYFLGVAVTPQAERAVAPEIFHPGADAGQFLSEDDPLGVVVGKQLAANLGLGIGDSASLTTISLDGTTNATDVIVRGIVDTPIPSMSKRIVYMNLVEAQKALNLPRKFSELALVLKDEKLLDAFAAEHGPKLRTYGIDLRTWYQIDPLIRRVEGIGKSLVAFMCFLLFISSGISVANIVYLLVTERTVEIGTLMAIGARPRDIRRLFVVEASMIAALGGGTGIVIGTTAIMLMDAIGIPFKSPFHSGLLEVHPKADPMIILVVACMALVICYAAALMPSRAAAKVEPVVAFRGQLT